MLAMTGAQAPAAVRGFPKRPVTSQRLGLALALSLLSGLAQAAIDLGINFTGPSSYTPGSPTASTYTLEVSGNAGSDADNPTLTTNFPAAATVSWTCGATGTGTSCGAASGSGNLNLSNSNVTAAGKLTYSFSVSFASSMAANPLVVTASADPTGTPIAITDQVSSSRTQVSDLSVAKSAPFTLHFPLGVASYRIDVANAGPSDASNIQLTDNEPTGVDFSNWNCTRSDAVACSDPPDGSLSRTLTIPAGVTYTYTTTATFALNVPASVTNTASLTVPVSANDPDSADHSSAVTTGRNPQADLSLSFTPSDSGLTYIPGTLNNALTLRVTNANATTSTGGPVALDLPSAALAASSSWSCSPASACSTATGSGDLATTVTLAASSFVDIVFDLDYDSGALVDPLLLTAVLDVDNNGTTADPDPDAADKSVSNSYAIDRRADLQIVKTATTAAVSPGASFRYDLVVTNLGPSDVGNGSGETGLAISDDFVAQLRGDAVICGAAQAGQPCWRYCPDDDGSVGSYTPDNCPAGITLASGNGDVVAAPLRLRAGSSSTLRAFVSTDPGASGDIANTATLALASSSPAVTELVPGNNQSTVTISATPTTDIGVSKTDGLTSAIAGTQISYTVTVRNNGFNTANNVTVQDDLPLFTTALGVGFVPGSISWQCRAFNGACCTHNGASNTCGSTAPTPPVFADDLAAAVDLPGQARVEYTITGMLDARSSGLLSNTASAQPPAGLPDAVPGNDQATDDTNIVNQAGLSISKRLLTLTPVAAHYDLTYEIVVTNAGPSRAAAASVSDPLTSTLLVAANAAWTCTVIDNPGTTSCGAASGTGALSTTAALDAGGQVKFELTVPTIDGATGVVSNTATVTEGSNTDSITISSPLAGEGDLSISKTDFVDAPDSVVPGTYHEYVITVRNEGEDDAFGAQVSDPLPPEFENASWTCAATTPVPGDLSYLMQSGGTTGGRALSVSGDGRHIYVISRDGKSVSAYDRVAVPGLGFGNVALLETELEGVNDAQDIGIAVSGLHRPQDVALSPDGTMLFVLSRKLDAVGPNPAIPSMLAAFNRVTNPADPAYGKLSFAGSLSAGLPGDAPTQLEVSQGHVYVSGVAAGVPSIAVFKRSPSTGLPTLDQTHTSGVPSDVGALAISIPEARLFAASASSGSVTGYTISDGSGATPAGRLLTPVTLSEPLLTGIADLVRAPSGKHLYVAANGSSRIGVLSYASGLATAFTYTATGLGLTAPEASAVFGPDARLAVAPDGEHVVLVNGIEAGLVQLRRDPVGGGLSLQESYFDAAAPGIDLGIAVALAPDGRHVFVASGSTGAGARQLTVYTRRAPDPVFGFLETDRQGDAGGSVTGLLSPADIATSPDGKHVYSVSLGDGALVAFARDARRNGDDTGGEHLLPLQSYVDGVNGVAGLARASRVMVSPDGAWVLVSSEDNNTVSIFARDAGTGLLTHHALRRDGQGGVDGLLGAQGMAMDASASHLYVAGSFEAAVAAFKVDGGNFTYLGVVKGGIGGATGMGGMRDLAVSADGLHVLGVGSLSNAVVVLNRDTSVTSANFGRLSFRQAHTTTGVRLMSIALPSVAINSDDVEHIYVVGQDDNSVIVLRRVTDPASTAFGTVSTLHEYRGLPGLQGPRDIALGPDGRRVFVAAQFSNSVVILDRDQNRQSSGYGGLQHLETRTDGADGVDGLNSVYALAVSSDSRNVYAAGFGDRAVTSFAVGAGSYCSAAGNGDIDDSISIGAGGSVEYRLRVFVRPDATGQLCNTAEITPPDRFVDPDLSNNMDEDCSTLQPQGDLSISKSNDQVSVVAGSTVRYEVRVDNPGPSNLVHSPSNPLTISDLLDSTPGFVPGSARWSCLASGSGALEFVESRFDGEPGIDRLGGVTDLQALADGDGAGPLPGLLAAASVLDNSLSLFARDAGDGRLTPAIRVAQGDTLGSVTIDSLAGARALAATADGRDVYVASRESDAVTGFRISDAGGGVPGLSRIAVERGRVGLDQATHLLLSPDERFLYVAGANDDAVAVFARDLVTGTLTWVESEQNGINDPGDAGAAVAGLDGVEHLAISPDGAHLYTFAGGAGTIARFDRDTATGRLNWREVRSGSDLAVALDGASAATFDASGEHLYVVASNANRIVVLGRRTSPSAGNYGELRLLSSVAQDVGGTLGLLSPRRAALSADGAHLYVTAQAGNSVAWFGRDPLDGDLRYLGQRTGDSGGVDGMDGATGISIDAGTNQIYVAGTLQSAIAQFARQSDSSCPASGVGELDQVPVSIAAGGSVVFTIDVDVVSDLNVSLVNEATIQVAAGTDPNPSNNSAADSDEPSLSADLRISKDDGLAAYDGLAGANALVGDARHLYVAGGTDNAIGHFVRDEVAASPTFGALRFDDVTRSGSDGVLGLGSVADLALSADGAHLYAVSPTENSIAGFARNQATGRLEYRELLRNGVLGVSGMSGARALALSPDGSHAYVVSEFANALVTFARDTNSGSPGFGRLSFIGVLQNGVGGVDGLLQPRAVAVSPDGAHVYTLGAGGSTLAVFRRNPNSGSGSFGQLTYLTRYVGAAGGASGLESATSLAFDSTGANLYVLGASPGTLTRYTRAAASGELTLGTRLVQGTGGVLGLAGAQRVRLSPLGDQLYVAGGSDASLSVFDLAAGEPGFTSRLANGDPAPGGGQVTGLAGARDVLLSADGAHAYAVASDAAALTGFDRSSAPATLGSLSWRETFFDGLGGIAPGEIVTYRIEVSNAGPASVAQANVVDLFPAQFVSASWTCIEQTGNGQCLPSGNGNLQTVVNLPAGGGVVFEAVGVLGNGVSGTLVNTATVSAVGVSDPDIANNSATDGNTVLSPALDLVASIPQVGGSGVPGGDIEYTVRIDNLGPTYAVGASVVDQVPAALREVSWSCDARPIAGLLAATQSLAGTDLTPPGLVQPPSVTVSGLSAVAPSAFGLHLYATATLDDGTGALLAFARDPLDGQLAVSQMLRQGVDGVSGIAGARHLVLSSDERFLYVAGTQSDAIGVFARNPGSGALTYVTRYQDGEAGIDGLGGVQRLLLAPGGAQLYAAGTLDDAIAVFNVNAGSGLLTPASIVRQSQPGMDGLNGVRDLAWSAGNSHLLAIAGENQSIAAFTRNPVSGALTFAALRQEFEVGNGVLASPRALEVDGQRVLVASANGRVGQFGFDPSAATPSIQAQGNLIDAGGAVADLLFDPDQARLYVATSTALQVHSLLGATPELLDSDAATAIQGLALSPDRRQLYSGGLAMTTWARERGSRCLPSGSGGIGAQSVDIAPDGYVEFRVGGLLFANATGNLVYEASVTPRETGAELNPADNTARDERALQPLPDLSASKSDGLTEVVAGLGLTYTIGLDNDGISAAIGARVLDAAPIFSGANPGLLTGSGSWTCAVAPALAQVEERVATTDPALQGLGDLAISPDGLRAYGVNASRDALLLFTRAPDGSLGAPVEIVDGGSFGGMTVQGLDGASAVAVSDDGLSILVTGAVDNSLVVFAFDPGTATHRYVQTFTSGSGGVSGLLGAEDVAIAPDGEFVYVAAPAADAIAIFRRDATAGTLGFVDRVRDGFGTIAPDSEVIRRVHRLWLSDDGRNLYALARGQTNASAEAVSSFARDAQTGNLTYLGVLRRSGVPALAGLRDVTAAPGDPQLYVLGEAALVRLDRAVDGRLQFASALSGSPGLERPRAVLSDEQGARVYLVDGGGALTVYARDWSTGNLAYRQRIAALTPVPDALAHAIHGAARGEILVAQPAEGRLRRYDERPLSHCQSPGATADGIDTLVDLDVDGHADFSFGALVHPSARGVLVNEVSISPAAGSDPSALPGVAQDSTTIIAVSDLSVEKSAPVQAVAGTDISYQIVVRNAGPSDALGLRVIDTLAPQLLNPTWTCTATGTSSCPASGGPGFDVPATLKVGEELHLVLTGRIAPSFLGTLPNRVEVIPEVGSTDPTPGDLIDTVDTEVVAEVDVSVSKDDSVTHVIAGGTTTYRIVIANAGPSDATNLQVSDPLPAGLDSISFTCTPSAGATCPLDFGVGVNFGHTLPPGESWTIDALAHIDDAARGQIENVVSATAPSARETAPANNSASDIDTVDVVADLAVSVDDPLDPFDPAGSVPFPLEIAVRNLGPSSADNVTLRVEFGRNLNFVAPSGCTLVGPRMDCVLGSLGATALRTLNLQISGLPAAPTTLSVTAVVATTDPDPVVPNNTDTELTDLRSGGDIHVLVGRSTPLVGGDQVTYTIDVRNIGSQAVSGFDFDAAIPPELIAASWTCSASGGASCSASGSGAIDQTLSLAAGQSVRFLLTATIDPSLDQGVEQVVTFSATATVAPGADINLDNNSDSDTGSVMWGIFRDGFEDPPPPIKARQEARR